MPAQFSLKATFAHAEYSPLVRTAQKNGKHIVSWVSSNGPMKDAGCAAGKIRTVASSHIWEVSSRPYCDALFQVELKVSRAQRRGAIRCAPRFLAHGVTRQAVARNIWRGSFRRPYPPDPIRMKESQPRQSRRPAKATAPAIRPACQTLEPPLACPRSVSSPARRCEK